MIPLQLRHMRSGLSLVALLAGLGMASPGRAMELRQAVAVAVESNPKIGQAAENREAIEFELRQARGLYMPRVDLETSTGVRRYSTDPRRLAGTANDKLVPTEAGLVLTQKVFDGFATRSEVERQAARVDSASFRVLERSEYIALQVAREYIQVQLQTRVLTLARENVAFHQKIRQDIETGVQNGTLTDADQFQAVERVTAAIAKQKQAEEDLMAARIRFYTLVGQQISSTSPLPSLATVMPRSLDDAIGRSRTNNPTLKASTADVDAADATLRAVKGRALPEVLLEGRARTGNDIDGYKGNTNDVQGRLVMRWNLFDGGIKSANEQEQIRRSSEQRLKLNQDQRDVEEEVRLSWDRKFRQASLATTLAQQLSQATRVVAAYQDQFKIGRRSLLDLLDAQNTRFNSAVLEATASHASKFANFQLVAATGHLLEGLGITPPSQSQAYARAQQGVPLAPAAITDPRYSPDRN